MFGKSLTMIDRRRDVFLSNRIKKYFIDPFAEQAKKKGLRSRAWFKLQEIDRLDHLLRIGMTVIDLGSSPGGWSSYAVKKIGNTGKLIACDKLPMEKIPNVNFLLGDCLDSKILDMFYLCIGHRKVQVVLSDMSPNTTGISVIDVNKSINLGNVALKICHYFLMTGGTFLVKIFQGIGFEKYLYNIKSEFNIVKIRKPNSSRMNSREVYIVAKELKKIIINV